MVFVQARAGDEAASLLASLYADSHHPEPMKLSKSFFFEGRDDANTVSLNLVGLVDACAVSEPLARNIAAETLTTLAVLHEHGIVHRDVKPEHVCLVNGRAMLTGCSTATRVSSRGCLIGRLGTPGFMAPEVILGLEHSHKADSFGMGVVLFFLLAGVLPFSGSLQERLRRNLANHLDFELGLLGERSEEARAIIQELLQSNPDERPSAAEVLCHNWLFPSSPKSIENTSGGKNKFEVGLCLDQINSSCHGRRAGQLGAGLCKNDTIITVRAC